MSFRSYIPRAPIHRPSESSRMVSPRSPNAVGQAWKRQRDDIQRQNKTDATLSQLRRQVERIPAQRKTPNDYHPFKIYQFPPWMRLHNNADDWRRFKVRSGGFSDSITFPGTDRVGQFYNGAADFFSTRESYGMDEGVQVLPSTNAQIVSVGIDGTEPGGWNEIAVPVGQVCHFWISMIAQATDTSVVPCLCAGASVTGCTNMATGGTFNDNWPGGITQEGDPYHYYIGYVSILDDASLSVFGNNRIFIGQWRTDNIVPIASPFHNQTSVNTRYRGDYSSGTNYWPGDVVTQTAALVLKQYVYWPASSTYSGATLLGPLGPATTSADPSTHTPDPWKLLSSSAI